MEDFLHSKKLSIAMLNKYFQSTWPGTSIVKIDNHNEVTVDMDWDGKWILVEGDTNHQFDTHCETLQPTVNLFMHEPGLLNCKEPKDREKVSTIWRSKEECQNNLILINPVAGTFYDPRGIRSGYINEGNGSYPLNWLISPDSLRRQQQCQKENDKLDDTTERRFWSQVPFVKIMGGTGSYLTTIKKVWAITYSPGVDPSNCTVQNTIKHVKVFQAVQMADKFGTFIVPDKYREQPGSNIKDRKKGIHGGTLYHEALRRSRKNIQRARRYIPKAYYKEIEEMDNTGDSVEKVGNDPFIWDAKIDGNMDLRVWVMEQGWNGAYSSENGEEQLPYTLTRISVRHTEDDKHQSLLKNCNILGVYHIVERRFLPVEQWILGKWCVVDSMLHLEALLLKIVENHLVIKKHSALNCVRRWLLTPRKIFLTSW